MCIHPSIHPSKAFLLEIRDFQCNDQCDQIWQTFATPGHLGYYLRVSLMFGSILNLFWQFLSFWRNVIFANGQILNKLSCQLVTLVMTLSEGEVDK